MGKINVLGFDVANLIAAGEVVDRPASVLKELLENAIDAGATRITAEIRRGGITMIRVTDNGHGIAAEDLPVAILRHATSKIKSADDLVAIGTLGFRGEALAAIAAVSRLTIITKTKDSPTGMMLVANGGTVTEITEVGASDGTTVLVENLFENIPARRSFLKKDATETMASTAVVEKVALSRPEISFDWSTDGVRRFKTEGDGELLHTLHALNGREFAARLLPVNGGVGQVRVTGYIGTSDNVRPNRNHQNMFINGRYVKSKTVMAALEKGFHSYIAPEKFPVCALFLEVDPRAVDVNVHPAKLEVKFSDERVIFEAVYYAVRSALENNDTRPEWQFADRKKKNPLSAFVPVGDDTRAKQMSATADLFGTVPPVAPPSPQTPPPAVTQAPKPDTTVSASLANLRVLRETAEQPQVPTKVPEVLHVAAGQSSQKGEELTPTTVPLGEMLMAGYTPAPQVEKKPTAEEPFAATPTPPASEMPVPEVPGREVSPYRIVGEVFRVYVIVEQEKELLLIDKHAAHERMLFEELKARQQADGRVGSQALLVPLTVNPSEGELSAATEYRTELENVGFSYTVEREERQIHITSVPDAISLSDAADLFIRMTAELYEGAGNPAITEALRRERTLYRVACRAAMKGGQLYGDAQIEWLVARVMALPDITVCPHGRPVAIRMTKNQLDRQFDRIV